MTFRLLAVSCAAIAAPLAYASGVIADPKTHSVSFEAVSTDCGLDADLEFLVVGPGSDRDYESMFVACDPVKDIAKAFELAGIPTGVPFNSVQCVFWPVGADIEMEPSIGSLVREMRGDTTPGVIYTGGSRDAAGIPEADTNMPSAVFALYNCSQSLLQFDDSLDQSPTYGRFRPAVKIPKGEKRSFTFRWNGKTGSERIDVSIIPGGLAKALSSMKDKAAAARLVVRTDFNPSLTVSEAALAAQALSMIDSPSVKINGYKEGQFYYRAFLPQEKWRERKERLAQPPEVRLMPDGNWKIVEILEDWSDPDSLDPKLTPKENIFKSAADAAKSAVALSSRTSTILVFAPAGTKLEKLYEFRRLGGGDTANWYVFPQ